MKLRSKAERAEQNELPVLHRFIQERVDTYTQQFGKGIEVRPVLYSKNRAAKVLIQSTSREFVSEHLAIVDSSFATNNEFNNQYIKTEIHEFEGYTILVTPNTSLETEQ